MTFHVNHLKQLAWKVALLLIYSFLICQWTCKYSSVKGVLFPIMWYNYDMIFIFEWSILVLCKTKFCLFNNPLFIKEIGEINITFPFFVLSFGENIIHHMQITQIKREREREWWSSTDKQTFQILIWLISTLIIYRNPSCRHWHCNKQRRLWSLYA